MSTRGTFLLPETFETPEGPYRFTFPANQQTYVSSFEHQSSSTYQPRRYTQAPPLRLETAGHSNFQQERLAEHAGSNALANSNYDDFRPPQIISPAAGSQGSLHQNETTLENEPTPLGWGAKYGFVRREPFSPNETTSFSSTTSSGYLPRDEHSSRPTGAGASEGYSMPRESTTPTRVAEWVAEQNSPHPTLMPDHHSYANTSHPSYTPDASFKESFSSGRQPNVPHADYFTRIRPTLHDNLPSPAQLPPSTHPAPALKGVPVKDLPQGVIASRPSLYRKPVVTTTVNQAKRKTGILAFRKRTNNTDPAIDALNNPIA